ncbi:MAG: helix-turn-helix domain-containing protein [Deferrisomatales bacterium]
MEFHRRRPATVRIDGGKARGIREGKGLTQLYVAEVVRVSVDTVSRWENNRTPAVKRENAEALAQALEVPLEAILQSEAEPAAPEPPAPREPPARRPRRRVLGGVLAVLAVAGAAWLLWHRPLLVEATRRVPAYTPPGSEVPILVTVAATSGSARHVILRETLPPGWRLTGAVPPPDQGPTPQGVVKWILPLQDGPVTVAYLVRAPETARESSAHRFVGEIVTPGSNASRFPVKGQSRIDLEYIHWADEDGDFQISDAEVLDALERVEAVKALGLEPADLRRLWGAPEYEWDRSAGRFRLPSP